MFHLFREDIGEVKSREIVKWINKKLPKEHRIVDGVWTRQAEEAFTKGLKRFAKEGTAETPALRSVLDSFKNWAANFLEISGLRQKLPVRVRQEFNNLFFVPHSVTGHGKMVEKRFRVQLKREAGKANPAMLAMTSATMFDVASEHHLMTKAKGPRKKQFDTILREGQQLYNDKEKFFARMRELQETGQPATEVDQVAAYMHMLERFQAIAPEFEQAATRGQKRRLIRKIQDEAGLFGMTGTGLGRALHFRQQFMLAQIQERLIEAVRKNHNSRTAHTLFSALDDFLKNPTADTFTAARESAEGLESPTKRDVFIQLMYSGILSGLRTHEVNALSNSFHMLWLAGPHLALRAVVDAGLATVVPGYERNTYLSEVRKVLPTMVRNLANPRGLAAAKRILTTGERIHDETHTKLFDITGVQFLSTEIAVNEFIAKHEIDPKSATAKTMRFLAGTATFPSRALRAMDYVMKVAAYEGFYAGIAERRAETLVRAGKLSRGEKARHVAELMKIRPEALDTEAVLAAHNAIFTDAPGSLTRPILDLKRRAPIVGNFIAPFTVTLGNIVQQGVARMPVLGILPMYANAKNSILRHKDTLASGIAKQIEGVVLMAILFSFFGEDEEDGLPTLTGRLPEDAGERAALMRRGVLPYSVRIGDRYVSFARLEPFSFPLAMTADLYSAYRQHQKNGTDPNSDEGWQTAAINVANNWVHYVADNSWVSSTFRWLDSYEPLSQQVAEEGLRRAFAIVPYNGFLREAYNATYVDKHGDATVVPVPETAPFTESFFRAGNMVLPFVFQPLAGVDEEGARYETKS